MDYKNTEKELEIFSKKIEEDLKSELKKEGYVKSYSLFNSIKVSIKSSENGFGVTINCNDYIKYLDKGKFLEDFLKEKKKELKKILKESFKKDVLEYMTK